MALLKFRLDYSKSKHSTVYKVHFWMCKDAQVMYVRPCQTLTVSDYSTALTATSCFTETNVNSSGSSSCFTSTTPLSQVGWNSLSEWGSSFRVPMSCNSLSERGSLSIPSISVYTSNWNTAAIRTSKPPLDLPQQNRNVSYKIYFWTKNPLNIKCAEKS